MAGFFQRFEDEKLTHISAHSEAEVVLPQFKLPSLGKKEMEYLSGYFSSPDSRTKENFDLHSIPFHVLMAQFNHSLSRH